MKRLFLTFACAVGLTGMVQAQTIEEILHSIDQNNKELQALRQQAEAGKMDIQARNNLGETSIEYSPFFAKGVSGTASSELIVSQGFDYMADIMEVNPDNSPVTIPLPEVFHMD